MSMRCRIAGCLAGVLLVVGPGLAAELAGLEVHDLHFEAGSHERLIWSTASLAQFYGLYRGRILPEGEFFRRYNHRCLATELGRSQGSDPDVPEPGSAFYYLANGLRPTATPTVMDWGPLGTGSVVRPEGALPCGRRIYVDSAATGSGDGSSWTNAYTKLVAAVGHPSPPDRSLEMWMTGDTAEYLTVSRGQLVFYGGFAGSEKFAWERDPSVLRFAWKSPVGAVGDLIRDDGTWMCEGYSFVFDGIDFLGGRHGIRLLDSGLKVELLRSEFSDQSLEAVYLETPSDYACGLEAFVDDTRILGANETGVFSFSIEGGDQGDLRMHRSLLRNEGLDLLKVRIIDGILGSSARVELMANELDGGNPALSLQGHSWEGNAAVIQLALASNTIHHSAGDGISMAAEGGAGEARIEGSIVGNTISHAALSGVVCHLSASGGVATCTPDLESNNITYCGRYGVEEPDDSAPGLFGDPRLVGNDLYGNTRMYLDEGVTPLVVVQDVNALAGNWGNMDKIPGYVNPSLGDYHLLGDSALIDACVVPPPAWVLLDMDYGVRVREGDGIAPALCDIGADEVVP